MPHHCCVPGCTSNSALSPQLAFHSFPSNPEERKLWVSKIRRDEANGVFVVNDQTRVCSKHFKEDDYHRSDNRRKRKRKSEKTLRWLKKGSFPSVFDCFPSHLRVSRQKRKDPPTRLPIESLPKRKCRRQSSKSTVADSDGTEQDELQSLSLGLSSASFSSTHVHCECVDRLNAEILELKEQLGSPKQPAAQDSDLCQEEPSTADVDTHPRRFCLDSFKDDNRKIRYYTGFMTFGLLMACFRFLSKSAETMRMWQGQRTGQGERLTRKAGSQSKITLQDQFFLFLFDFAFPWIQRTLRIVLVFLLALLAGFSLHGLT